MTDVSVYRVYDDEVFPTKPAFACNVGATSVSSIQNNAISATTSQHTYNIITPSDQVYLSRKPLWSSDLYLQFSFTPSTAPTATNVICVFGRDIAVCPYPLTACTSTMQASINDEVVTINTNDVMWELLRLAEYSDRKHSTVRKCPYYLDTYANYGDAYGTTMNALATFNSGTSRDYVPNGAFGQVWFTNQAGVPLQTLFAQSPSVNSYTIGTATVNWGANGIPLYPTGATQQAYPLFVKITSCEELILSPFEWSDVKENGLALFGIKNLTLTFTMQPAQVNRVIRSNGVNGAVSLLSYNTTAPGLSTSQAFGNAKILTKYLTPPLSLPLPKNNVVPVMNYPRYLTNQVISQVLPGQVSATISSQTITIDQIPDLIVLYVKPQVYAQTDAVWYYPIVNVSVNWNNQQALMSNFTREQLFEINVRNGIDIDYNMFLGETYNQNQSNNAYNPTQLAGCPLVIRPGYDFFLGSEALSNNMMGNYSLQINVQVLNPTSNSPTNFNFYMMCVNSGMFVSEGGVSRVVRSLVKPNDVVNAPLAPLATRDAISRVVGEGMKSKLTHALSRMHRMMPMHHTHHMHGHGDGHAGSGDGYSGARRPASRARRSVSRARKVSRHVKRARF